MINVKDLKIGDYVVIQRYQLSDDGKVTLSNNKQVGFVNEFKYNVNYENKENIEITIVYPSFCSWVQYKLLELGENTSYKIVMHKSNTKMSEALLEIQEFERESWSLKDRYGEERK